MSQIPSTAYRTLFNLAPVGMAVTTPQGELLDANSALLSFSGYSREDLRQRSVESLYVQPGRREELRRRLEREGTVRDFEARLLDQQGQERICLLTVTLERNEEDDSTRLLTIVRDITNYRQMEEQLLEISEKERRRIGQELHDGPASTLAGLSLVIRGLITKLEENRSIDPEDLRRVNEIVQREAEETRTLSHGLHVPELEDGGLVDALQMLARNLEFLFNASCHLEVEQPLPRLPKEVALHLYRIAQEAAHNAGQHADAQNIWIRLTLGDELVLTVDDDGRGLPEGASEGKLGLHTIRCRCELMGASCDIRSRPGEGTRIGCRLPRELLDEN